jgi:16S rRNA (cytosine967-C5)-methyltransferase
VSDARPVAARALDRIAREGVSLRAAFTAGAAELDDVRDRALLSALLHEGTRWWLRFDRALDLLLERPLRRNEPVVHALLVLGLVQIAIMGVPEYAAVAATVESARALRKPRHAALVNAVLRRFLRERATLERQLDDDPVTRHSHPGWLIGALRDAWPDSLDRILAADNAEATLTLRVNRRRITREDLRASFAAHDIESIEHAWLPDALLLPGGGDVSTLPGFGDGAFSVQDGAAQLAPDLLDLRDGLRVLDACAAPGGKTAHLLERANLDLTAVDRDAARLARIGETLARLRLHARLVAGDASTPELWSDGRIYERILLDAPCSATGVLRRQPDIRLHRRRSDIAPLVAEQARLLDSLWPLLAPGGRLVYATCSMLPDENERQVEAFLGRTGDARRCDAVPERFGRAAGCGRQNLPGDDGMDGFFYAIVDKAA